MTSATVEIPVADRRTSLFPRSLTSRPVLASLLFSEVDILRVLIDLREGLVSAQLRTKLAQLVGFLDDLIVGEHTLADGLL